MVAVEVMGKVDGWLRGMEADGVRLLRAPWRDTGKACRVPCVW